MCVNDLVEETFRGLFDQVDDPLEPRWAAVIRVGNLGTGVSPRIVEEQADLGVILRLRSLQQRAPVLVVHDQDVVEPLEVDLHDLARTQHGYVDSTSGGCRLRPLIGRIAAQSAFIFDAKERELREVLEETDKWAGRVYMDWGTYDLRSPMESWSIADGNMSIFKLLQEKGFAPTGGEVHDGTGWPSWRNRTDVIFQTLFPSG